MFFGAENNTSMSYSDFCRFFGSGFFVPKNNFSYTLNFLLTAYENRRRVRLLRRWGDGQQRTEGALENGDNHDI